MNQVNGLYGHVRSNEFRSLAIFTGFLLAFQVVAASALAVPLIFVDFDHFPFVHPLDYLGKYGLPVLIIELFAFLGQFLLFTSMIQTSTDFRYVTSSDNPRLSRIVENLAITAGIPKPRIALIDSDQCNAFACGTDKDSAVIVVTRGLLEILDDEELATVMAHEIVHIRDGDILLMACANIMVSNISLLSKLEVQKAVPAGCMWAMILIPVVPFIIFMQKGSLAFGDQVARFCRAFAGKSREMIADAEAVRLTHNPAALISALKKIEGRSDIEAARGMIDSMMIDGISEGADATHPSIEQRIAALLKLAGPTALAQASRRDTRSIEDIMKHRPVGFGRKGASASVAASAAEADILQPKPIKKRASLNEMIDAIEIGQARKILIILLTCLLAAMPIPAGFGWLVGPVVLASLGYILLVTYAQSKTRL